MRLEGSWELCAAPTNPLSTTKIAYTSQPGRCEQRPAIFPVFVSLQKASDKDDAIRKGSSGNERILL